MDFRTLRKNANLTQVKLALLSGVEQTTIACIERGKTRDPRWSTLSKLANVLGTTPAILAKAIERTPPHAGT